MMEGDPRPIRNSRSLASIVKQTRKLRLIIVEADGDKAIYEAILDKAIGPSNFLIYSALDLGANVGGKSGVLDIHNSVLLTLDIDSGYSRKLFFILDKDIDDVLGRLVSSELIVYTTGYNIEADLFLKCELSRVLSACLLKTKEVLGPLKLDDPLFFQRIEVRWHEWVAMCIFVRMHLKDNAPKFYSLKSQIHNIDGTLNLTKQSKSYAKLSKDSGQDVSAVKSNVTLIERGVRRLISAGRGHRLINGKWYPALLALELRFAGFGACCEPKGLWGVIIASLSPDSRLVKEYRQKLGL